MARHCPLATVAPMANGHRPLLLYKPYTSDTHGVKAFQSYTAKQRYTVYTAIHRYTLYILYNTPLRVVSARAPQRTYCIARIALVGRSSARPAGRDAGAGGIHLSLSLVSVVRVVAFGFYLVLLLCAPRMFIFAKRFSVTPTRNHYHHQLGCITSTDGRVKCVS